MWFLTVFGLMWSWAAIIALSLPAAISLSTSSSRSESSARIESAASGEIAVARTCCSTLPAIAGETSDSPTAAEPMPRISSSTDASLSRVAAGPGEDRVEDVVVLVGDRQHEDAGERREADDLPNRLDPAHAGHVQVHHDHLGRELAHQSDRVRSRPGLADDLYAALLEQVPQPGAEQVVVVYQQDANVGGSFLALDLDGVAQHAPLSRRSRKV